MSSDRNIVPLTRAQLITQSICSVGGVGFDLGSAMKRVVTHISSERAAEGMLIEALDLSTSMRSLARPFAGHYGEHLRTLRELGSGYYLLQLGFNNHVQPLYGPGSVEGAFVPTVENLQRASTPWSEVLGSISPRLALLRRGSRISSALECQTAMAIHLRMVGYRGTITLSAMTDGGNTAPDCDMKWREESEALARQGLDLARAAKVQIAVTGFIADGNRQELNRFISAVGLEPQEVVVIGQTPGREEDSVRSAVTSHTRRVGESMTGMY